MYLCALYPRSPEEGVRSLGTGAADTCDPLCGAGTGTQVLRKSTALSIAKPFLQLLVTSILDK